MSKENLDCKDFISKLDKIGKSEWVTVFYLSKGNRNVEQKTFFSSLIDNKMLDSILEKYSWDINFQSSGYPGLVSYFKDNNEIIEYKRNHNNGIEHLVHWRTFAGIDENVFEISEEFRFYYNLYEKDNKYYDFDEVGDKVLVAEILEKEIRIKLKYLKEYISVRNMSLAIYFEFMKFSKKTLSELGVEGIDKETKSENLIYSTYIRNFDFIDDRKSQCWILGKKIIGGIKDYKPRVWGRNEDDYQEFIIGIDDNGNEIYHTANEDKLSNNFGKNKNAPHHLTPVYFKKEVLSKYYSNPKEYEVSDGAVGRNGFWSLRIDNNIPDYIIVFLGDLGKLPNKEQIYWKSFNFYSEGSMSYAFWNRNIKGEFTNPDEADLFFKQAYEKFNELWYKKFNWYLFRPLLDADIHHLKTLHIPLKEEQKEFDEQVISLNKLIIDSLNVEQLSKEIIIYIKDGAHSIDKFEAYLKSIDKYFPDMIQFLRDLQSLRSTGSAHRKGKKYQKVKEKFKLNSDNYKSVFNEILTKSIMIFNTLEMRIIK